MSDREIFKILVLWLLAFLLEIAAVCGIVAGVCWIADVIAGWLSVWSTFGTFLVIPFGALFIVIFRR